MINLILMEKMLVMHTITPRRTGLNQMRGLLFGLLLSGVVCLPMAHADSAPKGIMRPFKPP
ncbi:MAG: hypothetical protein B7Y53_05580 [Halothiobacillus sp. 28-55-5]|nr:MAG: hypothetical protein B7Y53_05580 [Halothiobacillus sp. 28-55-5]